MKQSSFRAALLLAGALGLACSGGEYTVERQGGPFPTHPEQDPIDTGEEGVPFCAALAVLRDPCQRCHTDPPENGAPVPFLTYEDTQASYYGMEKKWWEAMVTAVSTDFMPLTALNGPPFNLMPPVEPLSAEQKETLLGWLAEGALPTGGTDCP